MGTAVAAFLFAMPAHADGKDASALIRRGVELRREHRNEEALAAFREADAIASSPTARAQIALAEQALGRWLAADRDLGAVLAESSDPWILKNRTALEAARDLVGEHCAWLTVDVDVEAAEVTLDGRPIRGGREERVLTGAPLLAVLATGYAPDLRHLDLTAQSHTHISIRLVLLVLSTSVVARETPTRPAQVTPNVVAHAPEGEVRSQRAVATYVGVAALGFAGIAGIAVGSYFGVQAIHAKNDRDSECVDGKGCHVAALEHDANARSFAMVSNVGFTVGVAALIGGTAWWWLTRPISVRDTTGAFDITPIVGTGSAGIVVRGRL